VAGVNSRWTTSLPTRITAAALCLAVAVIHVKDQGGFPGDKEPKYVGVGYYLLEVGAVVAAVLLIARVVRSGWLLSAAVALGPLVGYTLSRGPGMPSYTDDKGNWSETLGVISLVVEVVLLLLALAAARRELLAEGPPQPALARRPG
jgi:xanthine/uracil permease